MGTWNLTIDVSAEFASDDSELDGTFASQRDAIVAKLRSALESDVLDDESRQRGGDMVEQLSYADDLDEFDECWDEFYDWCDHNRVWIQAT